MKLRSRLILSFCLIAIIPILIFSVILTNRLIKNLEEDIADGAVRSATQAGEAIDVYIDVYHELMDYLIEAMRSEASLENAEEVLRERHREVMQASPGVVGVAIADETDRFIGSGMKRVSRESLTDEEWFKLAVNEPTHFLVMNASGSKAVITNEAYSADSIFSILGSGEIDGRKSVILMDIKKDVLQSLIESASSSSDSFVFVVDENGDIVYTPVNDVVYRLDDDCLRLEGGSQERVGIRGSEYMLSSYEGKRTGWRFISVTSLESQKQSVFRIFLFLNILTLGMLAVAVIISVKLADSFDKPIQKLIDKMHLVEQGDLSVRADLKYQDEIGDLGRNFDHMLDTMNVMMVEIQTEKQRTLQARLKSLQEQIKPHFLYNTLDTINWMARERGADDVVKMVEALTNMFRLGLSQGKDCITVREEIEHIKNYLYIQGVRYGEKLSYEFQVDNDTLDIIIPKLILQPLVENSIYHGIKLKKGGGKILIKSQKIGDVLTLSVYDNGAGMSRQKLEELRKDVEAIENGENGSFGMTYVIERLKLYAGDDFSINIESYEGVFTEVTIRLRDREYNTDGDRNAENTRTF